MTAPQPQWGDQSRFYLPNEDARAVRHALQALRKMDMPVRHPVFVGGSGMVLLDVLAELPDLESATFVDVAVFQCAYFEVLRENVAAARTAADLRAWFRDAVFPDLARHFQKRGQTFTWPGVERALEHLFGIRFFFDDSVLASVQRRLPTVKTRCANMVDYLCSGRHSHDFVYLSNIADYIEPGDLRRVTSACYAMQAPLYLLQTDVCRTAGALESGTGPQLREHHVSTHLNTINRGLGSPGLDKPWNRKGRISVLVPDYRSTT